MFKVEKSEDTNSKESYIFKTKPLRYLIQCFKKLAKNMICTKLIGLLLHVPVIFFSYNTAKFSN